MLHRFFFFFFFLFFFFFFCRNSLVGTSIQGSFPFSYCDYDNNQGGHIQVKGFVNFLVCSVSWTTKASVRCLIGAFETLITDLTLRAKCTLIYVLQVILQQHFSMYENYKTGTFLNPKVMWTVILIIFLQAQF